MKTIWKYDVVVGVQLLELTQDTELLALGEQEDKLVVWGMLDTDDPKDPRKVLVIGTGAELPEGEWWHVNTLQCKDGTVWHLFEDAG